MGFQSNIKVNGLSGELYFTIITATDDKFNGVTTFLLRGFESRAVMYDAIENQNYPADELKQISAGFERWYEMPLVDLNKGKWEQIYEWLRLNHFPEMVDVIE